jgi:hypothetical protein
VRPSSKHCEEILEIYRDSANGPGALSGDTGRLWIKSQKDGDAALLQQQTGQNSMRALICMLRPPTVVALIAPAP